MVQPPLLYEEYEELCLGSAPSSLDDELDSPIIATGAKASPLLGSILPAALGKLPSLCTPDLSDGDL